jgi:DNA gyrase/topoisomerase IV subunit B
MFEVLHVCHSCCCTACPAASALHDAVLLRLAAAGVTKLTDANDAGTRNSHLCTLILTEGDSAKTLAMSGLSVVGHDHWGVFPLR